MFPNGTKRILSMATIVLGTTLAIAINTSMNPQQIPPHPVLEPTTHPSAGESPALDLGEPVKVVRGEVLITLSAPSYREGEVIQAIIANGLDRIIYTEDLKSDCSIATLEQWDGENWQPILGCNMERLAFVFAIGPGRGRTVQINPRSIHFGVVADSAQPAFGAGTYRIKFTYRINRGPEGYEPNSAYSEPFPVER